jgi:ubiquinone/menaquinone biosynthesis C-methylase UbiE
VLGWLAGRLMASNNVPINRLVVELLEVCPGDRVLEIGFGPGTAIEMIAGQPGAELIAGVDLSPVMVRQASGRNRAAIRSGRVVLHQADASRLPFPDAHFDKAFAVNTFHHWSSQADALREVRRVLREGGLLLICLRLALAKKSMFAPPGLSEPEVQAVLQRLAHAGFRETHTVRRDVGREVVVFLARK